MFVEDLVHHLNAELGYIYGTNMFRGPRAKIPSGDGPFLSIIETPGTPPEGTHNAAADGVIAYERPSAQLVFRSSTHSAARTMADNAYQVLQKVHNQFINGTWWRNLTVGGTVFDLTPDEKDRARVAFNIDAVKRP